MADLFWMAATSHLVLAAVAGVLAGVLVIGYAPFVKYVPVLGPYVPVAKLAAFLLFGVLCALIDRRSADARAEIAQLQRDLAFSQTQLENQRAIATDKARLADASAASAFDAQMKANDYEQRLAARPVGTCALDDDDVRSLRNIRPRRADKRVGPNPARLRGFGKKPDDS